MRYFDAASGSYEYSTSQFLASSVSLSLFRIAGTELPVSVQGMTPFLKGIAEDVSFGASGPSSQFQAKRFKASFGRQKETHP
jgi:hypothetical protein